MQIKGKSIINRVNKDLEAMRKIGLAFSRSGFSVEAFKKKIEARKMTDKTAGQLKAELEKEIADFISIKTKLFEDSTGLVVSAIDIPLIDTSTMGGHKEYKLGWLGIRVE